MLSFLFDVLLTTEYGQIALGILLLIAIIFALFKNYKN